MVQVLGPGTPKKPSFTQRLNQGVGQAISAGEQLMQEQKKRKSIESLGLDPAILDLPHEAQIEFFKNHFKPQQQETALEKSRRLKADEDVLRSKEQRNLYQGIAGDLTQQEAGQAQTSEKMDQSDLDMNSEGSQQPKSKGTQDFSKLPQNKLEALAGFSGRPGVEGIYGNRAKAELEKRAKEEKGKRTEFTEERQYHTNFTKDIEKQMNQIRETIPKKETALTFARNAIETGDMSYFSPDKLAEATGIDLFRTAKGAQLLTAGKENLLSNMSRVGAKAQNIWFEQRLNSMFPKIGQSKEANLTVQEILEGELEMDKAYLSEFDRLSEQDEEKYGFVKKDISKRARDAVKSTEKEIMSRTSYRMKEIDEMEKGISTLKNNVGKNVIKGTPLTLAMAKLYKSKFGDKALDVAEKNGYHIPSIEEFQTYQKRLQE